MGLRAPGALDYLVHARLLIALFQKQIRRRAQHPFTALLAAARLASRALRLSRARSLRFSCGLRHSHSVVLPFYSELGERAPRSPAYVPRGRWLRGTYSPQGSPLQSAHLLISYCTLQYVSTEHVS